MLSTIGFALLAGALSALSPCVLPLAPIVFGTAISEHKYGPFALAAGLALSFTAIGLFIATVGFAIGLDSSVFRTAGGLIFIAIGAVLLAPRLQTRFALASGGVSAWTEERFGGFSTAGLWGQFSVGLLLGAVWSPCVGPTLGAASIMAAQGENLGQVALTMLAFGLGAASPLLALGLLSRETLMRWRNRLLATGKTAKMIMGGVLAFVGVMIVTNLDKAIEAKLVAASPQWLIDLTTRF